MSEGFIPLPLNNFTSCSSSSGHAKSTVKRKLYEDGALAPPSNDRTKKVTKKSTVAVSTPSVISGSTAQVVLATGFQSPGPNTAPLKKQKTASKFNSTKSRLLTIIGHKLSIND